MKNHNVFDISDLAAQKNPGWRVRWGAEGSNAVLLVNTWSPADCSEWKLVWCEEDPQITLSPSGEFIPGEGIDIHEGVCQISNRVTEGLPMILKQSFEDHYSNKAAPRFKRWQPYISNGEAQDLETEFFDKLVAPYLDSHTLYAVHESGSLLCKRLGISTPFYELFVSHYTSSTFQDDSGVRVGDIPVDDLDKPVLIIDDMVSSGHTAAAILKAFEKAGFIRVRYVALFNVVASRENHDVDSAIETVKDVSNFYWMYGRGMDLNDPSSRRTLHIYGADKSYGESQEDINELLNFFNQ